MERKTSGIKVRLLLWLYYQAERVSRWALCQLNRQEALEYMKNSETAMLARQLEKRKGRIAKLAGVGKDRVSDDWPAPPKTVDDFPEFKVIRDDIMKKLSVPSKEGE